MGVESIQSFGIYARCKAEDICSASMAKHCRHGCAVNAHDEISGIDLGPGVRLGQATCIADNVHTAFQLSHNLVHRHSKGSNRCLEAQGAGNQEGKTVHGRAKRLRYWLIWADLFDGFRRW